MSWTEAKIRQARDLQRKGIMSSDQGQLLRDARFVHGDRILLSRSWSAGRRAFVIGHNPSGAGADREDPTTRWLNAWFQRFGFGGYDLGNLYPFVTSDPAECRKVADWLPRQDWAVREALHFVNLPAVVDAAKRADQVFVCWGAIAQDQSWIDHMVEEIQTGFEPWPQLWCWGTNADGSPKHPMARGRHRIPRDQDPILWRAP